MKQKKTISRKPVPPFKRTLFVAKQDLARKMKQKAVLLAELKKLDVEIPNLQATVRALEAQLSGKANVLTRVQFPAPSKDGSESDGSSLAGNQSGQQISLDDIPPEIRSQLPPEDLTGIGSHFGDGPAPKEDFLPEIEGSEDLLPKKTK